MDYFCSMKLNELPSHARIWVYQCNRELTPQETAAITETCNAFVAGWASHGNQLAAGIEVRYNRFIVVGVDEQQATASGCSIDKSVHLMKQLEADFALNLFDRMQITYRTANGIEALPMPQFSEKLENGALDSGTIVFNNLVQSKADFDANWEVPVAQSWHQQLLPA